ncbi:nuclear receptor-binding factor 2-like [Topomyia yanbarensis]|uniref:nuclear receptor-binding factor 2-like n=1 Tax=Topomyia yanbarensis TaxID=2498891 RepID=UPI00273C3E90|nr:nuclear receptor-binding factor 2-like [Topomyia yanbarensis]
MENSYLNVAHVYGRKAEHYAKHRRYDEAIESHRRAVSNMDEALKISPPSAVILESLQLQRKYHLKQAEFLRHKKQQHERYMKAVEYQRRRNPEYLAQQMEKLEKASELQVAIYRNMDETDSLLETLAKPRSGGGPEIAAGSEKKTLAVEELISLNHSLHLLIHRMVQNLDEASTENEALKERISMYEKESHPASMGAGKRAIDRGRDPLLETGRDALEAMDYHSEELPALELPTFDLSGFENH